MKFVSKYLSHSRIDTQQIATEIFNNQKEKTRLFLFTGGIGCGKTTAIGAIFAHNGQEFKGSPTFNLKNTYNGFIHYDLYLVEDIIETPEFEALLDEELEDNNYIFVEWANRFDYCKLPFKFTMIELCPKDSGVEIIVCEND